MRCVVTDLTIAYNYLPSCPDDWHEEFLQCFKRKDEYITLKVPGIVGDAAKARWNVIQACSTEFLAIVDPDDLFDDSVFLKMCQTLKDNPSINIVTCGEQVNIYDAGRKLTCTTGANKHPRNPLVSYLAFHPSSVMRMSALKERCSLNLLRRSHNPCFVLRYVLALPKHIHLEDHGYTWRKHMDGYHKVIRAEMKHDQKLIKKELECLTL